MVNGIVVQFRRGRKTYTPRHFIIEIPGSDSKEKAAKFVGKEITWTSPAKKVYMGRFKGQKGPRV